MSITLTVPAELAALSQWCVWTTEMRDGKVTKVPIDARTGQRAKVNDPETWCSLDDALYAAPRFEGVGFVFTSNDPFCGIDLDSCIPLEGGVRPWASPILDIFAGTYCEISPSGAGIKIFAKAKIPRGMRISLHENDGHHEAIELYDHGRFFTFTGNRWNESPLIVTEQQTSVDRLIVMLEQRKRQSRSSTFDPQTGTRHCDLAELSIKLARAGLDDSERERVVRERNAMLERPLDEAELGRIIRSTSSAVYPATNEWSDPIPLDPPDNRVPALSLDMLPQPLSDFVADISQRLSISPDLPAGATLAMLGAAIGRSIQLQPQPWNPWTIPPNLWCCLIAEAGFGKSPVISAALKPLLSVQQRFDEENTAAMREYNARLRTYKRHEQAARKGDADPGDPPESPSMRRLLTNNATFEAIHAIAQQNPNGLLLLNDELVKFWEHLDAPALAQTKGHFLQSWNGNDSIILDRILRGQNLSAVVCLSQLGGAQPDLVRRYIRGMRGDGWLQRYSLLLYPDQATPYALNRTAENQDAREAIDVLVGHLCNLRNAKIRKIQFNPDAQALYESWLVPLVNRQRGSDENSALVSHFVKYQSAMPQLALLFEIANNPSATHVSAESTDLALRWVREYLDAHALRVYGLTQPGGEGVHHLAAAIHTRKLESGFTVRDVRKRHWRGLGTDSEINEALDVLIERGWVRVGQSDNTGRPTTRFEINPHIR